jgi:hypothetical protein
VALAITGSKSVLGATLSSVEIEKGLRELCPDIHFDMPNNLEEAAFVAQTARFDAINANRQGVYWNGRYLTGMDRGLVTEFKVWEEEDGIEEIPPGHEHLYDDGCCTYIEILPIDSFYSEALSKAQAKDDNFTLGPAGQVYKWAYFRFTRVRGRIIRMGWRHTFENLATAGVPGITRRTLAKKFNVDLSFKPVGPDAGAAFTED